MRSTRAGGVTMWRNHILAAATIAFFAALGADLTYTVLNCNPRFDPVAALGGLLFVIPYIALPTLVGLLIVTLFLKCFFPEFLSKISTTRYVILFGAIAFVIAAMPYALNHASAIHDCSL